VPRNWPVASSDRLPLLTRGCGRSSRSRQGASIGDAQLWYDTPKKTFSLLVSLEIEVPEPTEEQLNKVVGGEVGSRYLAVTSPSTGKATFSPGKRVRQKANHYARLRKRWQKKGTRGARRRLKRIEQRERRLKLQGSPFRFTSYQGRCRLYLKSLSCLLAYRR
jgi:transposase